MNLDKWPNMHPFVCLQYLVFPFIILRIVQLLKNIILNILCKILSMLSLYIVFFLLILSFIYQKFDTKSFIICELILQNIKKILVYLNLYNINLKSKLNVIARSIRVSSTSIRSTIDEPLAIIGYKIETRTRKEEAVKNFY